MKCEIPILQRCCFCIPLRIGLLVWAYLKQVLSVIFISVLITNLTIGYRRAYTMDRIGYILVILYGLVDIVFHVLFIISAHKKDYRKMRLFYRYSVVVLCLDGGIVFFQLSLIIWNIYLRSFLLLYLLWSVFLPALAMTLVALVSQAYLIILVRSEFIKLKNNSQFEFVNRAADEKCTANLDFAAEVPATT